MSFEFHPRDAIIVASHNSAFVRRYLLVAHPRATIVVAGHERGNMTDKAVCRSHMAPRKELGKKKISLK